MFIAIRFRKIKFENIPKLCLFCEVRLGRYDEYLEMQAIFDNGGFEIDILTLVPLKPTIHKRFIYR